MGELTVDGDGDVGFAEALGCMDGGVADGVAVHGFEDGDDLALGIDVPFAVVAGGVSFVEGGVNELGTPGTGRRGVVGGIVGEEGSADGAGAGGDGFPAGGAAEGMAPIGLGVDVVQVEGCDVVVAVVAVEDEADGEFSWCGVFHDRSDCGLMGNRNRGGGRVDVY